MNQQLPPTVASSTFGTASPPNQSGRRFSALAGSAAQLPLPGGAPGIAGDILYGADAIAIFMFGDSKHRRRVYNLVDGNGLPVFRIGVNICARKSVLLAWIAAQEALAESPTA